jgi:hypothetical protein
MIDQMPESAGWAPDRRGASGSRRAPEQALCAQVFVDIRPVDAESTPGHTPVSALLGGGRKEARIPYERHRDGAAVQEIDD